MDYDIVKASVKAYNKVFSSSKGERLYVNYIKEFEKENDQGSLQIGQWLIEMCNLGIRIQKDIGYMRIFRIFKLLFRDLNSKKGLTFLYNLIECTKAAAKMVKVAFKNLDNSFISPELKQEIKESRKIMVENFMYSKEIDQINESLEDSLSTTCTNKEYIKFMNFINDEVQKSFK